MSKLKRSKDLGRKYLSGCAKRKLRKAKLAAMEEQKAAVHKFVIKNECDERLQTGSITTEDVSKLIEMDCSIKIEDVDMDVGTCPLDISSSKNKELSFKRLQSEASNIKIEIVPCAPSIQQEEDKVTDETNVTEDPATWPEIIDLSVRDYLVKKGPPQILLEDFPRNKQGRHFSKAHCKKRLKNGEIIYRPWVIYSESADKIFCFYCRLFGNQLSNALTSTGFNDWSNIHTRLAQHEKSKNHLSAMLHCCEVQEKLSAVQTIDRVQKESLHQEKMRPRHVLERLVAIIQFLSERNLAFRGSVEKLGNSHNGNFLGLIELLGKFDPVMNEHLRRFSNKESKDHYLGKSIQNELLSIMADAVQKNIINRVKAAKYFAVIVNCISDINQQEQISLAIRFVSNGIFPNAPAGVYEHFIKFINLESNSGENLYNVLKHELQSLGLDINNIRGQGYDNGANLSGVQAHFLQENARAFCAPCACHYYNLVLGDVAKTCPDVLLFFGTLQRLYGLFSASTKRWAVLTKHVKRLPVRPLGATRWECHVQSVKAMRYQVGGFYDALLEIVETTEDAQARSEAEAVAGQMKDYKFLVSLVFWYSLLFQVNFVSKELQSKMVDFSAALSSFEKLLRWLVNYRERGFEQVLLSVSELANELETMPVFQSERLRKRKKPFDVEAIDDPLFDPKETFKVQCFNRLLDKIRQSLESQFEQLKNHENLFGFLGKFQLIEKEELAKHAETLETALTDHSLFEKDDTLNSARNSDLDGRMLVEEMEALKPILSSSHFGKPLEILHFLAENERATLFPNLFVALQIYLTIPVSFASGDRSVSRLKLIKTYLRVTMIQERLNSFAVLSIESEEAKRLNFDEILDEFFIRKARRF